MCWYFTLISMFVVVLTIVVVIGSDISKEEPVSDSLIFEDCTKGELQYYARIQPELGRFMTCENYQGMYHSVPMVTRSDSSLPRASGYKCNNPNSDDIYDILPVYHSGLGINFRNVHCLLDNHHISIDKRMYFNPLYHQSWRMYVSRECFYANIARVTKMAFSNLLKLLTTSDVCSPIFLPPRIVYTEGNISRFYHNLHVRCLHAGKMTSIRMLQTACKVCAWLFDEYFAACDSWNGTGTVNIHISATYTNIMLHVIDSKEVLVSRKSQRCLDLGCYKDQCNNGELGYGSECFNPIEYVDGVVSELWMSHTLHDQESINEAIVAHLYRYVLNVTKDIAIRIVDGGKGSAMKMSKCASFKVVLMTKSFVRPDELNAVLRIVEELRSQEKIEISNQNTQSIIYLHSRPKTCTNEVHGYLQISQGGKLYIFLGVSIMLPIMLLILAALGKLLKEHLSRNT